MGLDISFWILAVVGVIAALAVVSLKNVFRSALALVLCFVTVAGIYVTLSADFLAVVQILIYVGAISVLIILAVMMTRDFQHDSTSNKLRIPALFSAVILFGIMVFAIFNTSWNLSGLNPQDTTTSGLAVQLFSNNGFVLPVEIAGMLLLAAIIGAIILVREK